jgi:heme exporter protein A
VLMTTHNLERGLELGDRVAILAGGRIAYQADKSVLDAGRFREIYYQYVEG